MKKIIRAIIILLTFAMIYFTYVHFYSITSISDVEKSIENKLGHPVEIVKDIYVEDEWLVYFKSSGSHGYFYLSKGYNDKYRLGSGFEVKDEGVINFANYRLGDIDYLIIMGSPQEGDEIIVEGRYISIEPGYILQAVESDLRASLIDTYRMVNNNTSARINLPENSIYEIDTGEINNGPREIVIGTCILIFVIGYGASCMFTPKVNRLEKLYFKITKSGPRQENPEDKNDYMMLH